MTTLSNAERIDALKKDRKFITKSMLHYFLGDIASFTMIFMMAPGIIEMFASAAAELYPNDKEKQAELVANHNVFYNTQPNMTIVPGIVMGLEMERAKGEDIPNEVIQSIKAALAGSFAGIGDSIVQGILTPTLLSIGMGLSQNGSGLGAIFVWLAFFAIMWPLCYWMFKLGMNAGAEGATTLLEGEFKDRFIKAISLVGCIVVGGVCASTANLALGLSFGDIQVQGFMDGIFPGLTTLLGWGLIYTVMKKKQIGALKMVLFILIWSIAAYFLHIM